MLIFSGILALTFICVWVFFSLSHPIGILVDQASNPSWIEALSYKVWGTGEIQLRIMGIVVLIGIILSTLLIVSEKLKETQKWVIILATINIPWIYILSLNHLGEGWSLIAMNLFLLRRIRTGGKLMLLILMATTSFAGWWGALALAMIMLIKRKWIYILIILLLGSWMMVKDRQKEVLFRTNLMEAISPTKLAEEINWQKKIIYLSANKSEVMPQVVSKLTYNKVTFGLDNIIKKTVSVIDPTMWTAIRPAWVITKLSAIPPKGIWDSLYYWQIPLGLVGLVGLTISTSGILLLGAAGWPLIMANTEQVNSAGALLIPMFVYLTARGINHLNNKSKWFTAVIIGLNILGFGYFTNQVYIKTDELIDNRVVSYQKIYSLYKQLATKYQSFVITDRHGPTEIMLKFYTNSRVDNVKFKAFDWTTDETTKGTVYIGFTREFVGDTYLSDERLIPEGKIVGKVTLADEPVYKFGKEIWAVEK